MQTVYSKSQQIGWGDYGNIYLKRNGGLVVLKRYSPTDYADMEEYIRDNHDTLQEWQEAAYNGDTEMSYEDWMNGYSYDYEAYYDYDSDNDEYYDGYSDDTLVDSRTVEGKEKQDIIDRVIAELDESYAFYEYCNGFNRNRFIELIGEYYDECKQYLADIEEQKKPHWNVFSYYK